MAQSSEDPDHSNNINERQGKADKADKADNVKGEEGNSRGVEKFEKEEAVTGTPSMEPPVTVAVLVPMCTMRSGRGASQGTSLRGGRWVWI